MRKIILLGLFGVLIGCAGLKHQMATPEKSFCMLAVDTYQRSRRAPVSDKNTALNQMLEDVSKSQGIPADIYKKSESAATGHKDTIFDLMVKDLAENQNISAERKEELYTRFDLREPTSANKYSKETKARMRSFYDNLDKYCYVKQGESNKNAVFDYKYNRDRTSIQIIRNILVSIEHFYLNNGEIPQFEKENGGKLYAEYPLFAYFLPVVPEEFRKDRIYRHVAPRHMGIRVQQIVSSGVLVVWDDMSPFSEIKWSNPILIETNTHFNEGQIIGNMDLVYDGEFTYTTVLNRRLTIPKFKPFSCNGCLDGYLFYLKVDRH